MRLAISLLLVLVAMVPVAAAECRPLAQRFEVLQETTTGLIGLVQARPVDWRAVRIPQEKRADFATLRSATDAMLPALQRYVATGKNAVAVLDDCRRYDAATPAGQVSILQTAVIAADRLVPLLVRYLVAYDAALGVP